jgi:general secretion pathway protein D
MALTWLCLLLHTAAYPAPSPALPVGATHASTGQAVTERRILLNFRDADITQLITLISDLTGKTFVVDNSVRGTVTLISPHPVSLAEAYQVFLSVLKSQGFTAVPQGPIVKIIPAQKAKERPLPYRD